MRHGDLWFEYISELPKDLKELKTNIVAKGEATGHAHVLLGEPGKDFKIYENEKGVMYLSINNPTKIDHQEHKQKEFAPGYIIVHHEKEFDPFAEEINRVRD